jgi:hypothetical protein
MNMPGLEGAITIKADQRDALACENATLTHAGRFGENAAQEQAAKVAKTHDDSTPVKSPAPKPLAIGTPRPPSAKKGIYGASTSNQPPADQQANDKKKGLMIRKFQLSPATWTRSSASAQALRPNRNSRSSLFSGKIWMPSHGRY